MSTLGAVSWLLVVVGAMAALSLALSTRDRARTRRAYDERVGLDLEGLLALLPEELRRREYTTFVIAPSEHADRIRVGLVYKTQMAFRGTPPNVGLAFDRKTGALVEVHPEGIGLGVK
jgi:hypothetical protein